MRPHTITICTCILILFFCTTALAFSLFEVPKQPLSGGEFESEFSENTDIYFIPVAGEDDSDSDIGVPKEHKSRRMEPIGTLHPPKWLDFSSDVALIPDFVQDHTSFSYAVDQIYGKDTNINREHTELQRAHEWLLYALDSNPNSCIVPSLLHRAKTYASYGMLDEAVQDLDYIVKCAGAESLSLSFLYVNYAFRRDLGHISCHSRIDLDLTTIRGNVGSLRQASMKSYAIGQFGDAVKYLLQLCKHSGDDYQAWMFLASSHYWNGNYIEAARYWRHVIKMAPYMAEGWNELGNMYLKLGRIDEASNAFRHVLQNIDHSNSMALYRVGDISRAIGDYESAAANFQNAIQIQMQMQSQNGNGNGNSPQPAPDHVYFHLLGVTFEGMGAFSAAFEAYGQAAKARGGDPWFDPVLAAYRQNLLDTDFSSFDFDKDLDPSVREHMGMGIHSNPNQYFPHTLNMSISDVGFEPSELRKDCDAVRALVHSVQPFVDRHSAFFHLANTPGFSNNWRQRWALSLGSLECAQLIRMTVTVNGNDGDLEWKDIANILVRYRRVAEVSDMVFWSNDDRHIAGTHMIDGEFKNLRYYPYHDRSFGVMKSEVMQRVALRERNRHGDNDNDTESELDLKLDQLKADINATKTPEELCSVLGKPLIVIPIEISSTLFNRTMKGSSLEFQKQHVGYWLQIMTYHDANRSQLYEEELTGLFAKVIESIRHSVSVKSTSYSEVLNASLRFSYFWFNYMPLVRGSAAIGYGLIQSLLWSAGFSIDKSIPRRIQIDFEAMLSKTADAFVERMSSMLTPVPLLATGNGKNDDERDDHDPIDFPMLSEVVRTPRHIYSALNEGFKVSMARETKIKMSKSAKKVKRKGKMSKIEL